MGKKIDGFQMRLNRMKYIPGPGTYKTDASLTGSEAQGLVQSNRPFPEILGGETP